MLRVYSFALRNYKRKIGWIYPKERNGCYFGTESQVSACCGHHEDHCLALIQCYTAVHLVVAEYGPLMKYLPTF